MIILCKVIPKYISQPCRWKSEKILVPEQLYRLINLLKPEHYQNIFKTYFNFNKAKIISLVAEWSVNLTFIILKNYEMKDFF